MLLFDPFVAFDPLVRMRDSAAFVPSTDIVVGEHDTVLTMDLPGLTADDLSIEVRDGHLVVRGERKRPEPGQGSQWALSERGFGAFERRVRLPEGLDADAITASMDNGVLSLIVPKPERLKPKTIAIKPAAEQRQLETAAA
jgi:HSP20 family protein